MSVKGSLFKGSNTITILLLCLMYIYFFGVSDQVKQNHFSLKPVFLFGNPIRIFSNLLERRTSRRSRQQKGYLTQRCTWLFSSSTCSYRRREIVSKDLPGTWSFTSPRKRIYPINVCNATRGTGVITSPRISGGVSPFVSILGHINRGLRRPFLIVFVPPDSGRFRVRQC